jgi:two-component system, LuxR family, response regulator FixJ
MNTTNVVHVVDDDDMLRESMADFLAQNGYAVRRHTSVDAFFAARTAREAEHAIVISDVRMPGRTGLNLLRDLQAHGEEGGQPMPVVLITGHASVPMAVDAMRAGALHFLEKPVDPDLLLETVATAFASLARPEPSATAGDATARLQSLTPREREVLAAFVARGSNKAVATALKMSPRTVEVHRTRIFRKSGATCVPELVRIAIEAGIRESISRSDGLVLKDEDARKNRGLET